MKIELIKYGLIFGFLKEEGNFVIYLGPILIAFTSFVKEICDNPPIGWKEGDSIYPEGAGDPPPDAMTDGHP